LLGARILSGEERDLPVLIHEILGIAVVDDERFTIRIFGRSNTALDSRVED
jgi:hypothetical protein